MGLLPASPLPPTSVYRSLGLEHPRVLVRLMALGAGRNRVTPLHHRAAPGLPLGRLGGWEGGGPSDPTELLVAQHRGEVPPPVPFLWQAVVSRRSFPFIVTRWVTREGKDVMSKLEKI